ncbi:hypothetical protein Q4Q34_03285 [Flavivirga abyssicola]|uniref:hypothetical protein n=1 Tax=Flavivirga abyssicola TaxID=3063533 RepID=UPI0026E06451|nr:hypothetical protein [Flavivirga sp. MEBiC07777]WVK14056.1 hypothetical protein Q4Q34_03285 [Flavivirga sp. MEBiC07777]
MSLRFQTYKPLYILIATVMSFYFVAQLSIQNYLTESNTEVVSLKKEAAEDSEKKDTIEELKEDYKKLYTPFTYNLWSINIDENFVYYAEKDSMIVNFEVLIPPPEQV